MWSILQENSIVWNFDSTGSIHKAIRKQPMVFFYLIVVHDCKNKKIIPIFEFLATCQTAHQISNYLNSLKLIMEINLNNNFGSSRDKAKYSIAPIIVVDYSPALIKALLGKFNGNQLFDYIYWCYDLLVKYKTLSPANKKTIQNKVCVNKE